MHQHKQQDYPKQLISVWLDHFLQLSTKSISKILISLILSIQISM